ncbi:MAG: hypothetical protein CMF75_10140 [Maricaulis sp.]|nr:hypothetical protein [Maricaulis sp.]
MGDFMGFNMAWLAFKGLTPEEVHAKLGLTDSQQDDPYNEADFSGAQLPTGWYIVWIADISLPNQDNLAKWSQGAEDVLCAQISEGAMISMASAFRNGAPAWWVLHNSEQGVFDLQTGGELPACLDEIRAELTARQTAEGGETAPVDFIFDIPLTVLATLCGFEHSKTEFDWGQPRFTRLDPVR